MASWVTHLMIADGVMKQCPELDRRGFCVGNIAPDCNVENEDWTAFTPPREVTHWMSGQRKVAADCERFCDEYLLQALRDSKSNEQYSFLLGYYAHLLTDAEFQFFIRDEQRVRDMWERIKADEVLRERAGEMQALGMSENYDFMKKLLPKKERMHEIYSMEAEYLKDNPSSGYLTEILPLKEFPDYIDYLPKGGIVRKIGVMGYVPKIDEALVNSVAISREEFWSFAENTTDKVVGKLRKIQQKTYMFAVASTEGNRSEGEKSKGAYPNGKKTGRAYTEGAYPTVKEAEVILAEAESRNPGPWGDHSRNVAMAAKLIAARCEGMDADKAYVCGLLHDIGRRYGGKHLGHVYDGYMYMKELGYDAVARICLSHSFNIKDIHSYIGNFDIIPEQQAEVEEALQQCVYDDYDRLIQLCDSMAGAEGIVDMEERMGDVKKRYGHYPQEKWDMNLRLRDLFEEKCGMDIYDIVKMRKRSKS